MPLIAERPILSKISDEIFDRLETLIAVPNDAFTFVDVVRPTKIGLYTPQHALIVLTRGEQTRLTELDCPGNPPAIAYQQVFYIRVHIAPSERDATPLESFEDVAQAEIIKAIRSSATWHTMDGNAINSEFNPMITMTADGGYSGIAIPLLVTYRIAEDDPYTARP